MNSLESRYKLHFPSIIGISQKELDNLIEDIDNNYREWVEPKIDKNGNPKTYKDGTVKKRVIRPSKTRLKIIQKVIKDRILNQIELPANIHGGIRGKSNITNAKAHQGNKYLFETDLQDFYPSIKSNRVHDTFIKLGFNRQFAFYITRLTTWKGELPQGTPTSTHISNLIFLEIDYRLIDFCKNNNISYTRYIDDLTFSSQMDFQNSISEILEIVKQGGLKLSYRKTNYACSQSITGIEVYLNKIDAPQRIIMKVDEEAKSDAKFKPFTNYRNNILKTNKRKVGSK
jgi:RNA-directed DNA polymerase